MKHPKMRWAHEMYNRGRAVAIFLSMCVLPFYEMLPGELLRQHLFELNILQLVQHASFDRLAIFPGAKKHSSSILSMVAFAKTHYGK